MKYALQRLGFGILLGAIGFIVMACRCHSAEIGRFQIVPVEITRFNHLSPSRIESRGVEKTVIKIDTVTGEAWQFQHLDGNPGWRPIGQWEHNEDTNTPPVKLDIDQFKLPK